jgi:predicted nucleotidyltransferase
MPVRPLSSSVTKWPDRRTVLQALTAWAELLRDPSVVRIGCIGSYARGDWGFGSDLDIVIVVTSSSMPFESRSRDFDTTSLPVPADLMVFTEEEVRTHHSPRFKQVLEKETVWVYPCRSVGG